MVTNENSNKKIQSVKLNLQSGQVEIIIRALELYKFNLNYMLDTEKCTDKERQNLTALVKYTYLQVKRIQAEQVNGKSEDIDLITDLQDMIPEIEMIKGIIPLDKTAMVG